jgi:hypothetical protein
LVPNPYAVAYYFILAACAILVVGATVRQLRGVSEEQWRKAMNIGTKLFSLAIVAALMGATHLWLGDARYELVNEPIASLTLKDISGGILWGALELSLLVVAWRIAFE